MRRGHTKGSGHSMRTCGGKQLRMARAWTLTVGGPHLPALTNPQIVTARHVARVGGVKDVARAIGWKGTIPTLRNRLKRLNIIPRNTSDRSRFGGKTCYQPWDRVGEGNERLRYQDGRPKEDHT